MKILLDVSALFLLYVLVLFRRWRAQGRDVLLVNTVFYIYLSVVLYFTLMPVLAALPFMFNHPYTPMNLIPFIDVLYGRGDFLRQVALNAAMTVPFGFLFPLTGKNRTGFGRTVLFCFLLSLSIEVLQPLINGFRSSDITDLITNTLGGMLGYALYRLSRPLTQRVLYSIAHSASKNQKRF